MALEQMKVILLFDKSNELLFDFTYCNEDDVREMHPLLN